MTTLGVYSSCSHESYALLINYLLTANCNLSNHSTKVAVIMQILLNAAPFENRGWRIITNHRTGFTDEMCMTFTFDIYRAALVSILEEQCV